MDKKSIEQLIMDAMDNLNQALEDNEKIVISPDCKLYGISGQLTSINLVALLIDIEDALQDRGIKVSLSDERAMSESQSPFRNVPSLVDYIAVLISEK